MREIFRIRGGLQAGGAPAQHGSLPLERYGIYGALEAAPKCRSRPRPGANCLEAAAIVAATGDVDPASEHSRFGS